MTIQEELRIQKASLRRIKHELAKTKAQRRELRKLNKEAIKLSRMLHALQDTPVYLG
jgi:hypothetical protein